MFLAFFSGVSEKDVEEIRKEMTPEKFRSRLAFLLTEYMIAQEVFERTFPEDFNKWKGEQKGS